MRDLVAWLTNSSNVSNLGYIYKSEFVREYKSDHFRNTAFEILLFVFALML